MPSFFLLRVLLFFCESYFSYISCFPRRLQDVFAIRLPKTSSRRLQDVLQDVFRTFSRRLQDVFQDIFKTSSRRLQEVFARRLGRQKNVTLKTSSIRLQDIFRTSSPRRMFAWLVHALNMAFYDY